MQDFIYGLFYILLSACIIYPPVEFLSAGFTIPVLFSSFLGSEDVDFILYHIKRSMLTLFVYSVLPLGYVITFALFGDSEEISLIYSNNILWKIFFTTSLVLPMLALYEVSRWKYNNYEQHPIVKNLSKFCDRNMHWQSVASNINIEFRRVEKFSIQPNAITKIIATENWILKVTPLTIFVTHQSDTNLIVKSADTHLSPETSSELQYLTIEVKSDRQGVDSFVLRINSSDFKDLQNRVTRRITILPNVKFHRTIIEQFMDAFKETIKQNPKYDTDQVIEQCIGCLQARPSIKLQKMCGDNTQNDNSCTTCYCRPMWCIECIAKWFVSRQDSEHPSTWLSSKCTCPMCRAKFCLLDVCILSTVNMEE